MTASRALAHPVALLAMALLIVNDHMLKAAMPGVVTGKLSDIAGMMFFPLLLAAAIEQLGVRRGYRTVVAATWASGIAFAAIKLSATAGELYRIALALLQWPFRAAFAVLAGHALPALGHARLTADPTDLVALLALVVPLVLARTTCHSVSASSPDTMAGQRSGSLTMASRSRREHGRA